LAFANAGTAPSLAAVLHLASCSAESSLPSAAKLSIRPARLARSSQMMTGRLASVDPRQLPSVQFQLMSLPMILVAAGAEAGLAE
jgi:hypothetical protein